MDKIWIIIQDFRLEDDSWDYDVLSAWSSKELAEEERERLRQASYRCVHVFPANLIK